MQKPNIDFLTHKFEMGELVFNTEKNCVQIVLAKVPLAKRGKFKMPKMKRSYICTDIGSNVWDKVLGENLRPAAVDEL